MMGTWRDKIDLTRRVANTCIELRYVDVLLHAPLVLSMCLIVYIVYRLLVGHYDDEWL